ncbi:MAG: FtsX-like permease family protein [Thiohalocapsa sp.]|uniref:ABC transporter permease n=1 Tax=Thiohalocapsa sp. TaxID=2497641 RepID=UPI0025D8BF73|nr:FtsX-like permease family protein [Thiohalocapsa sp.]MCG6942750.1 FtsX-like permease family protein [Thiohalocapsa sp.]
MRAWSKGARAAHALPVGAWLLALKLLRRDWRSGELYLLSAALVLTVAAITAVGFFTDRIERAMERQGGELIAADLAIDSSRPIPERFADEAARRGLGIAHTLTFASVVLAGDDSQLVQVKAVDDAYPLRGKMRLEAAVGAEEHPATGPPAHGSAWVEPRLLYALGSDVGTDIDLGEARFAADELIAYEPDRGGNFFQIAPRVMIRLDDLPATGLVTEASRVRYRLLLAGEPATVAAFAAWAKPLLPANAGLLDARDARPEFASAVERASRFLHLAALTTLLVAGAAMALASRRLVERQTDAVAVMRCLGAPRHLLTRIFALRLLAFGLIASLLGCLVGWLGQRGLASLLAGWFDGPLPAASIQPVFVGLGTGLVALAGFALPPLLQLADVPPLRVLRRDLGAPRASVALAALAAAAALAVLLLWQAADFTLAWKLLLGVIGALTALVALGALLVWLAGLAAARTRGIWRLGLAGLARRPAAAILQIVGFGLGILALLLLAVVRVDLLRTWQDTLPEGAPNRFLINIQPHEKDAVADWLAAHDIDTTGVFPMIRGRLTGIGGATVEPDDYADPRAQRLAARDFNLSYGTRLQQDNEVIAGRWWGGDTPASQPAPQFSPQFSVEEGIAETLGITLGDELRFWVAGRELAAPVTSLRRVQWDSFNVNFFVIGTPGLLEQEPATYVTSFYLPAAREALVPKLLRAFPSGTIIDVGALLDQVRGIIEQGIRAVEYVFLFTLAAGLVVMYAGIQASLAVRRGEHGVLRTLGANRRQLLRGLLVEFTATGLLAGLTASIFAEATGYVLAHQLFKLPFTPNPWLWVVGVLGSGVAIGLAGTLGTYRALVKPPLAALRRAG